MKTLCLIDIDEGINAKKLAGRIFTKSEIKEIQITDFNPQSLDLNLFEFVNIILESEDTEDKTNNEDLIHNQKIVLKKVSKIKEIIRSLIYFPSCPLLIYYLKGIDAKSEKQDQCLVLIKDYLRKIGPEIEKIGERIFVIEVEKQIDESKYILNFSKEIIENTYLKNRFFQFRN